ncbi:mitochondrial Rho GTPase 2-like [Cucurbita moschata]|uniref:Mitochondrial Rho GTPase n=1 Tax=Cucurbita moschata TaxID=3662 RepID=A0A6J1H6I5_CUCMO|nr:mitochondrial Rho GTPase 2-like [Cucurbita moschata]
MAAKTGTRTSIRIVVAGDRGTGKSSLIAAAASESFPDNVPSVLPPTHLPADFYPDGVPLTIIDSSSSMDNKFKLYEELKRADAVLLTYACDQPMTLTRLTTYWLNELHQLGVKAPVILVGCKLDLRDEHRPTSMEDIVAPIMKQFREIETCIECSAATLLQVPEVFYYAQRAVLHPTAPLFDLERQSLKPRCKNALRRIFTLCDRDMDGALSDEELNEFQVKCFNAPLQPNEIVGVKRVVQENLSIGVNDHGLTLPGFLFLHALFIEKGRLETTWAVLRKFGYDDDLNLSGDYLPVPSKQASDQSMELSNEALDFLRGVFQLLDTDNDGALRSIELEELFSTAPECPWDEPPYKDSAEKTTPGNLTLSGFLSQWALMTILDPPSSLANLIYIGYGGDPAKALRVTRRRLADRKKQKTERNVFQCFVFGPKKAGKSALLNTLIRRPFSKNYSSTTEDSYAMNMLESVQGGQKTLILREIPEDGVQKFLSNEECLAGCDVAVFVYDSSDEDSWNRSRELLVEIARKGEVSGFGVPCIVIAAKDDLDPTPLAVQDSVRVCQGLGIESPIPVSSKSGDSNNVFNKILSAAEHPHACIPETERGRNRKRYHKLFNRSLIFVSVGAAAGVVGLAAFRAYAARKNTSN